MSYRGDMRLPLPISGLLLIAGTTTACFGTSQTPSVPAVDSDAPTSVIQAYRRWREPSADARPVPDAPNVVFVILCTWRADQLGPWGGPAETAPTLVRLASQGVVFDTAIGQAPWTRPASSALLTGRYPDDIGMTEPEKGQSRRALRPEVTLLSERLHDAGWSTVGVVANPNLNAIWGFDQGFDAYVEMSDTLDDADAWRATSGTSVVQRALAEIAQRPDPRRPVFVKLVMTDAHAPVFPPKDEVARFAGPAVPDLLARYRAAMHRGDAALAELLSGLSTQGIDLDNTLVVLAADHGEGLSLPPSHGPHHGYLLYPSTVRVPVVISGPGVGVGRIGGLTTQLDLVPSLLSLLGQPASDDLDGEDLSAAIRAGEGEASREVAYTSTRFRWADRAAAYTDTLQCQTDNAAKETAQAISRGVVLAFDTGCCRWREDPGCERPEWDAELLGRVGAWRAERDRAAAKLSPLNAEPNAVVREQLRVLGYEE